MPRGKTRSTLTLSERREEAYSLYARAYTVADVARKLDVSKDTAARYKQEWEERLDAQTAANPHLLRDVLRNTYQTLEETDAMRAAAWREYEDSTKRANKISALGRVRDALTLRANVLGVLGVKQEFYLHVQQVQAIQSRLLQFMRENLCAEDRRKLEQLLLAEFGEQMGPQAPEMPVLEAAAKP